MKKKIVKKDKDEWQENNKYRKKIMQYNVVSFETIKP